MTTVIRLDASALQKLIEIDPDFKLEVQRAVVVEITRKLYVDDVATNVKELVAESFKDHRRDLIEAVRDDVALREKMDAKLSGLIQSIRSGTWGTITGKKLSPEVVKAIDDHVGQLIADRVREAHGGVEARIKAETKKIEEAVVARIGNLAGVVEHNVKAVAFREIQAQVKAEIVEALGGKK